MATFDYAAIREEAKAILEEFGNSMTVKRYADSADPVAGTVNRVLSQQQSLTAVILPASQGTLEAFDVRFMSDVLEGADVRFTIMSASGSSFTPGPKDVVEFWEDGQWQVMGCTPLNVAGIPVIFSVGLKRA